MRRYAYRTVEYGGRRRGSVSYTPTSDALVLDREDLAYILKALHRGTDSDKAFARRMFHTLLPVVHCASCGRRVADDGSVRQLHGKTLCGRCWHAFSDVEYCLDSLTKWFPNPERRPLDELAGIQKSRVSWCPPHINYCVTEDTYGRYLEKYRLLFRDEFNEYRQKYRTLFRKELPI